MPRVGKYKNADTCSFAPVDCYGLHLGHEHSLPGLQDSRKTPATQPTIVFKGLTPADECSHLYILDFIQRQQRPEYSTREG